MCVSYRHSCINAEGPFFFIGGEKRQMMKGGSETRLQKYAGFRQVGP